MGEFDVIASYFTWNTASNSNVVKSVGDDAAVLSLEANQQLVTSIDTLVSGVHFPVDTAAYDIGHKALAVNLSDLAAMGAKPEWFTLALTLPEINHEWLGEFSRGLKTLAEEANIALVGGDTTSGPLTISIQVMGSVEKNKALMRSHAQVGDKIYVTGTLGDGAAGLQSLLGNLDDETVFNEHYATYCQERLNKPTARLKESQIIKRYANACIDVSDGLLQDLSHILKQSNQHNNNTETNTELSHEGIAAQINTDKLPLSEALQCINPKKAEQFALAGGDDYELLFTMPANMEAYLLEQNRSLGYQISCIGRIIDATSVSRDGGQKKESTIIDAQGRHLEAKGFNHFDR